MAANVLYVRVESGEAVPLVQGVTSDGARYVRDEAGNDFLLPGNTHAIIGENRPVNYRTASGDVVNGVVKP